MPVDVLCIGHAAYDISASVPAFPAENSKCEIQALEESGGGPAANAAYLLSRWGVPCAFAGTVGDDDHGRRVRKEFQDAGTDVSLLELRPGHPTPVSLILINRRNGSRTLVNRKAPGSPFRIDAAAAAALSPAVLLLDGHELPASLAALEACPRAVSILDAGSWRDGTAGLAGRVGWLVASERFAGQATGLAGLGGEADRREAVRRLRERYANRVVVTLGEHGLIADDGSGFLHVPAFPAAAVDTTAAGDIFHGAFAHAVLRKLSFPDALRFASMTASLSVRKAGGRGSIPSLAEVREALTHAG